MGVAALPEGGQEPSPSTVLFDLACYAIHYESHYESHYFKWVLANSDEYHLCVGHASQSIQCVQNYHVVKLSGCDAI